jgi:non-specific serine/threonine protein kinase
MSENTNRLAYFWQELKRRKVVHFLVAYLATCFAVIEFVDITSGQFNIPDGTIKLLYLIAAIGLPLVILLPWLINRKKIESTQDELSSGPDTSLKDEKQELHNLPAQLTNFIGREKEIPLVRQLIKEHRLVSLIGAGGCGKTRLAIEVSAQLIQDYKDGVWFVDLAPITSEDLVAKEITEVLKIQEVPNQPFVDTIIEKIKNKNLLIILDNCEHLVKACAEITGKLIQAVPGLKIIATSREALSITGEQVWRVPSLTLIDPKSIIELGHAKDSEAVMLFADRARLNNPEFELEPANVNEVATICNKLDGIPLALELVASRVRHMNTHVILERFADRFDKFSSSDPGKSMRQQTLHATIEWSFNLLSENEKILFPRLAVFSGGFDIESVEKVCSDDQLTAETILDELSRLVDRSMIYTIKAADQSMRYSMLETLRQFAQQKLQSHNEEETRKRHLQYYLKMAEQSYDEQFDTQQKWVNKLEVEHDNMMAALNWSESFSPDNFVKLSGTLHWFWRYNYHLRTGQDYLERALAIDTGKNNAYGRAVFGLGYILWYLGGGPRSMKLMGEGVDIFRKSKNQYEKAYSLATLSAFQASAEEYEKAVKGVEESLELARKTGKPGIINHCMQMACQVYVHSKKYDKGRPLCEELLVSSEKLEHHYSIIAARHLLSDCSLGDGNFEEAEKLYGLALETAIKYHNVFQSGGELQGLAFALSGQSRWAKSIQINAAAREHFRKIGISIEGMIKFWDEWIETYIGVAEEKLGEELTKKYEEEGIAMGFDKAVEYALDFEKD